ncbi:leucyl aminopeptidase [Lactobacillus johnsonii]|jgi:hypothetical protein|uniref:Leucyl aminopeptidase n=1 Tax=Lactobacillus johnsonii TaxID=33959 RepID=A0A9X7TDD7_LACJH|nr:leucyl aminopeptidase [Lactobacillus johnsonii]QIA88612.1 leucyl aminopeptidase [Lactobacillus johnsonii]
MKKFNEDKFAAYLYQLTKNFENPSNDYDEGAYEVLGRICKAFDAAHYEEHDEDSNIN